MIRILHLEDDPNDAELIRLALRDGGVECEVALAATQEDFMALLARGAIDLILADFQLPGFGGLAALDLARAGWPDIPFIFVSGTMGEEVAVKSLQAGARDYVLKDRLARLIPAVLRAVSEAEERCRLRNAEADLAREQQFLRAVLDSVGSGILACDERGVTTLTNRALRETFGLPDETFVSEAWVQAVPMFHPDGVTPLDREARPLACAMRGERVRDAEIVVAGRGGVLRTMLVSGQQVQNAHGLRSGAVLAMHDITERNQLEEQLAQSQKMEAVGRLAGGVAHDFNNLLTVILGYGETLRAMPALDDSVRRDVEEIVRAGECAAQVTRQLMAFSRPHAAVARVLNLNTLVGETERMVQRLLGADVVLVCKLGVDPKFVKADSVQIQQLLLNLVVNARDAMPNGGRLEISVSDAELDAAHLRGHAEAEAGAFVLLSVSDSGIGMDEATQARIFEPFFTTKGPEKGTGLGLSIAYGIVRRSRGVIEVNSRPGAGTTFRVYLPRACDAAEPSAPSPARGAEPGSEAVLMVDDDESLRTMVREALLRRGYRVRVARNGHEALDLIARENFTVDLVVASTVMPGMSGFELARRLAARSPRVAVLLTTGYAEPDDGPRSRNGEVFEVLPKPFTPQTLLARVRDVLDDAIRKAA